MTSFLISPEAFDAFSEALQDAPAPNVKLRQLMNEAVTLWEETKREAVPSDMLDMIRDLK